jgi:hypothetical protein
LYENPVAEIGLQKYVSFAKLDDVIKTAKKAIDISVFIVNPELIVIYSAFNAAL